MTASLTIDGQTRSQSDLLAWHDSHPAVSDNSRAALEFCHRWLSGAVEFVVHTSGSTGTPQPITLHRDQMIASAEATGRALILQTGMRALVCLPVRYIAGQMMLVRGLVLGLPMTVVEPASNPWRGLPADANFDFSALVPLQIQTVLDGASEHVARLNRLHAILVGGAPVSPALEERIRTLTVPVYHTYGMTETATHVALRRLNGPDASQYFQTLPGVEIDLDERSCLRVKGPMTLDHWLQTNDVVQLSDSQSPLPSPQPPLPSPQPPTFRWLGRWDNVINTGGVKVQVEIIEAAVAQVWRTLGLVDRRSFVAGLPDQRLGQAVTLVIEGEPLDASGETTLLAALAANLDLYEVPKRVIYLPTLATTDTGKIDRRVSLSAPGNQSTVVT